MEILTPPTARLSSSKPSPIFTNLHLLDLSPPFLSLRSNLRPPTTIAFAKWNGRRSASRKSNRILLQSAVFLASNLKIVPEPLEFLIREVAGGDGGRFGFRNWLGGGGSDGRERKLGFWVLLVVSGLLLCFVAVDGGRMGRDPAWIVPILAALGLFWLGSGWKREMRGWLLGFCCGASMVGLGLQSGNLVRLSEKFRASNRNVNPFGAILGKTKRRRRWRW